jgi:hypothetical protein
MRMTQPNGIWTEHGITSVCCYDASYQAIGLVYGTRYLALLGSGSLYDSVASVVQKGESWELSRTRPDGTINISGDDRTWNGRTCPETTGSGHCKQLDLDAVFGALMRWGVLSHSSTFTRRAYFVWLQNWQAVTGQKLPAPGLVTYPRATMTVKEIGYGWPFFVGGTRFQPLEHVKVYFGRTLVGETTCDQIGSFGGHSSVSGVKFTPPASTTAGTYHITVHGNFGTVRTTKVEITDG